MHVSRTRRDTAPGLLSRNVRKEANQTNGGLCFHGAVDDRLLLVRKRDSEKKAGQKTGGGVPILGHTHPVKLSLDFAVVQPALRG